MRLFRIAAALCAVSSYVVATHAAAPTQESLAPVVEEAARGLANVSVLFKTEGGKLVRVERAASGFVVDAARGLLLTHEHLVKEIEPGGGAPGGEFWLQVDLEGGRSCGAKLLARDERLDLALLELDLEQAGALTALVLASGPEPAPGTPVVVVSRPAGNQSFALAGVVSAPCGPVTLRQATLEPGSVLVSDVPALEELDGGPVVDRHGVVLGILNNAQRARFDPKADENKYRNPIDYSVVVRASAIRQAFPAQLGSLDGGPGDRGGSSAASGARGTVDALVDATRAVVGVWAGAAEARPRAGAPGDPHGEEPGKGLGSGVVIDPAGLVLTSLDTVRDAGTLTITLQDGKSHGARLLKALPASRIALLLADLPAGTRLPFVELGSSAAILPGEDVAAVGNPFGHAPQVSRGVLAAVEKSKRLRIAAWVHGAHKGGALLDATGRLIGIPVADAFEDEEQQRGESYLGVAQPMDSLREGLAEEFAAHATLPGLKAPIAEDPALAARRRNKVAAVVEATRESLLNVEIKAEAPKGGAFDPFATAGRLQLLGQGSGVVIDDSGLAITNWHVVRPTLALDGSQRTDHAVEVTLATGKRFTARVLATSRDDDLALIQLELPEGLRLKAVSLGASVPLRRGDPVVAIGNPYGRANTVTVGIVAAKDQDVQIAGRLHTYENMLQTDAAINPGNSGGAMLDLEGRLVGINSAGRSGAGLAIPVERVRAVFGQKLLSAMGPFLGMTLEDSADGLVVREVDLHGPAAAAGVQAGDLARALDGRTVASTVEWGNALQARGAEPTLTLRLERGGRTVTATIAPLRHAVWRIFRQTGVQVAEVDYAAEAELVREASTLLHRTYTGLADGAPSRLMAGALRVTLFVPLGAHDPGLRPGDLLLGASQVARTLDGDLVKLVRFESLEHLRDLLDAVATQEGSPLDCHVLRDGQVIAARLLVRRVRQ